MTQAFQMISMQPTFNTDYFQKKWYCKFTWLNAMEFITLPPKINVATIQFE